MHNVADGDTVGMEAMPAEIRHFDLDTARGAGIALVVVGHTVPPVLLATWIYSFHMPMFFVISGFVLKESFDLKKRARALLIPFFLASLLSMPIWLLKQWLYRRDDIPLFGPLLGTLYGANLNGFLAHNTPLWFLPAMFSTLVAYKLLVRLHSHLAIIWLGLIGLLTISIASPGFGAELPMSFSQGLIGGLFLAIGFFWGRLGGAACVPTWAVVGITLLWPLVALGNGRIDMLTLQLGNRILFVVSSIVGSVVVIWWSWRLGSRPTPLAKLGRQSLFVLVTHMPLLIVLRAILRFSSLEESWYLLVIITGCIYVFVLPLWERLLKAWAWRSFAV